MQGESMAIIVCVRNTAHMLEGSLSAIKRAVPKAQLIVVDGNSTDGSPDIARKYADVVVSDEGKGLAYARQLGINTADRPFVAFVGPDNLVTAKLMYAMQHALEGDKKLAAVAPQTEVVGAKTYWENATKHIFRLMINRPGPVDVVGTPCMYKREIVTNIQYDPAIRAATDDTDLSLRLKAAGYKIAIIDAFTEERNDLDRAGFVARWRWYGKGDAEFYNKYRNSWTLKRRVQSLTHPFRKYGIRAPLKFLTNGAVWYIPALFVAMWSRYSGWRARARELRHG